MSICNSRNNNGINSLVLHIEMSKIALYIDNSRTGLDTSKNQCSAPAVTALKIIDGIMSTIYYTSPSSGEAYRDRRLTTNFEF